MQLRTKCNPPLLQKCNLFSKMWGFLYFDSSVLVSIRFMYLARRCALSLIVMPLLSTQVSLSYNCCSFKIKLILLIGHIFPGGVDSVSNIHEMQLDLPDECHYLLQATMMDYGLGMIPQLQKYRNYAYNLPDDILIKNYQHYKKGLQCIFYNGKTHFLFANTIIKYIQKYQKIKFVSNT